MELRLVHAVRDAEAAFTNAKDPAMYEFLCKVVREPISRLLAEAGTKFRSLPARRGSVGRVVHKAAVGHDANLILFGRSDAEDVGAAAPERLLHHSGSTRPVVSI